MLSYSDSNWFGFHCLHRASVSPRHRAKYLRHATAYALAEIATDY
jgi:hypothetical protein